MKIWALVLGLGVLVLVAGGVFVGLHYHRTIGLGALGLGIVLTAIGAVGSLVRRGPQTPRKQGQVKTTYRKGLRRAVLTIVVVAIIGVGTFYGVSYLTPNQASTATSTPGSSSQSTSTSATTFALSTSQTSSQSQTVSSSSGSESQSQTGTSQQQSSSGASSTITSGTTTIGTGSGSSSSSAESSSQNWPFVFGYSPTVVLANGVANLNVSYTSSLGTTVKVSERITLVHQGGSESSIGSPPFTVPSGGSMELYATLGTLSPGSYSVVFYVINDDSGAQMSESATLNFSV